MKHIPVSAGRMSGHTLEYLGKIKIIFIPYLIGNGEDWHIGTAEQPGGVVHAQIGQITAEGGAGLFLK